MSADVEPARSDQSNDRARVVAHYLLRDERAVDADCAIVEAMGIAFIRAGIDHHLPYAATDDLRAVSLLYLSSAELTDQARLEIRARVEAAACSGQPVLVVELDATTDADQFPPFAHGAALAHYALPVQRYQRMLRSRILECLDNAVRPAATHAHDSHTLIVPRALGVTTGTSEHLIPPDFRGLVSVGRSESCQICIDSTFASRLHGCLRTDGERFLYRDMSTNGTLLLGGHEELLVHDEEVSLLEKGSLRIGDVILEFAVRATK